MDLDSYQAKLESTLEGAEFVLRLWLKLPLVYPPESLFFLVTQYRRKVVILNQCCDVEVRPR